MALAAHSNDGMQHSDTGHGRYRLSCPRNKIKLQSDALHVVDHFYTIIYIYISLTFYDLLCQLVVFL